MLASSNRANQSDTLGYPSIIRAYFLTLLRPSSLRKSLHEIKLQPANMLIKRLAKRREKRNAGKAAEERKKETHGKRKGGPPFIQ